MLELIAVLLANLAAALLGIGMLEAGWRLIAAACGVSYEITRYGATRRRQQEMKVYAQLGALIMVLGGMVWVGGGSLLAHVAPNNVPVQLPFVAIEVIGFFATFHASGPQVDQPLPVLAEIRPLFPAYR